MHASIHMTALDPRPDLGDPIHVDHLADVIPTARTLADTHATPAYIDPDDDGGWTITLDPAHRWLARVFPDARASIAARLVAEMIDAGTPEADAWRYVAEMAESARERPMTAAAAPDLDR